MTRPKKRKGKIKIKQSAKLIHKNDNTRVARKDTISAYQYPQAPTVIPSNAATFKVRIRKKK